MRPIAQSDGADAPWLIDKFVPGFAAMIEQVFIGCEDSVREPVVAHELPDVFGWVEFGAFWRQRDDCDVFRHAKIFGHVPSRLIDHERGVFAGRDPGGDLLKMQVHRLAVAGGQDKRGSLAVFGADGAENIGRGRALVVRGRGPCSALGPAPRDLVLLPDARFVGEPDFYCRRIDAFFLRDLVQAGGEVFLKASIAPSAWA
jgi:hypothetical protein